MLQKYNTLFINQYFGELKIYFNTLYYFQNCNYMPKKQHYDVLNNQKIKLFQWHSQKLGWLLVRISAAGHLSTSLFTQKYQFIY